MNKVKLRIINPNSAEILQSVGMHCLGCAMAHGETIEEAVFVLIFLSSLSEI